MKAGVGTKLNPTKRSNDARDFEAAMRRKIVGQDAAVEKVAEIYQMFLAGLNAPGRPVGNLLFLGPTGSGKCLAKGTLVLMYDGTIRKVEDIRVGDLLMGPDSKPRKVLSLAHGWDEMYDVVPVKGDTYRVNEPHILSLQLTPDKRHKFPRTINIPVVDYLNKGSGFRKDAKGYRTGVEFSEKWTPIDPYWLGLWLGDGTSDEVGVASDDGEVVDAIYAFSAAVGMQVSIDGANRNDCAPRYRTTTGVQGKANPVLDALRHLNLVNNKHIPLVYKANGGRVRSELLAGLIDSDGWLSGGTYGYSSESLLLANDVAYIARSLGLAAYVVPEAKGCPSFNGEKRMYYKVSISGDISVIPVRIVRKKAAPRKQKKNVLRTGITVEPAGYGEYFGFEIDNDGLFLLGDFTVTHNTRVVEAMAESLFGDARACIKIDCAEFQHSHEIAKLIGSPPGYLGHRETHPLLTQEALNQWHTEKLKLSILLFDEIEKASDSLWQLLLGILDKATLTLGDNRRVDLSSCVIVMTSNLGAADMNELMNGGMGFANKGDQCVVNEKLDEKIQRTAVDAARRKFSPEFMNRIDKSVVFKTLRPEHLVQILEIELGMVQQRVLMAAGANQFVFNCTPAVKALLLKEGTDPKYGARHLKRAIERNLVFPLANLVATAQVKLGDFVRVDIEDGELTFTKEAEGAMVPVLMERYGAAAGGDLRKPVNIRPVVQRTPLKNLDGGGGTKGFGA